MAEAKHVGQYYVLSYQSQASPVEWKVVACLTQKSFKSAVATIDATSDCGPDQIGGTTTQTFSIQGIEDYDPSPAISGTRLYQLQSNAQNQSSPAYTWKLEPASPIEGDTSLLFNAFISNYQQDYNTDNPITFSADLGIQGLAEIDVTT